MSNLKEVTKSILAETTAAHAPAPAPAQVEIDEDELPIYYRRDLLLFIPKLADKLNPTKRHRMIRMSPDNMGTKRLKGWRPVEDREFLKRLQEALGGSPELINPSGHLAASGMELWARSRKVSDALQLQFSQKAHADGKAPAKSAEAALSDIEGRSGGAVQPYVSFDPTSSARSR